MDVSNNVKIADLQIGTNKISKLTGLQNLSLLRILATMSNPLNSLDVSANMSLQTLNARNSGLTKLDVSVNAALTTVEVFNSGATYKNVFTACGLDSLYRSLPDRTGKTAGTIRVISTIASPMSIDNWTKMFGALWFDGGIAKMFDSTAGSKIFGLGRIS